MELIVSVEDIMSTINICFWIQFKVMLIERVKGDESHNTLSVDFMSHILDWEFMHFILSLHTVYISEMDLEFVFLFVLKVDLSNFLLVFCDDELWITDLGVLAI